jgi:hypothetical protein
MMKLLMGLLMLVLLVLGLMVGDVSIIHVTHGLIDSLIVTTGVIFSNFVMGSSSPSCSVSIGPSSIDQKKVINTFIGVVSLGQQNKLVELPNFAVRGSNFVVDSEVDFWNNLFGKRFPKYKDRLEAIFPCCPLEAVNLNIIFGHIFSHLQNCPINITYVVDPNSIPSLGITIALDNH